MRTGGNLADLSADQRLSYRDARAARTTKNESSRRVLFFMFSTSPRMDWVQRTRKLETRNSKTFLGIRIVDAVEFGQLETNHVFSRGPYQFFFSIRVGVARDGFGGHRRVFLVDFAVHDEKSASATIETVMLLQRCIEFVRISLDHGFVDQCAGAGLGGGTEKHTADDGGRMGDAFEDHDLFFEVFIL